jgi:hypothetical protein
MRAVALVLLLVACKEGDGALYPINPGGGGGGNNGTPPDAAALGDGAGSGGLAGRVCLIADARQPTQCASSNAAGFTVTLDGNTATTSADGTFTIASPQSTNLVWQITGTDLETSLMSYSAVHRIPAMLDTDYLDLANANSVVQSTGFGDVFVHVSQAGTSAAQVGATVSPAAIYPTLYDGGTATTWTQTGTGAFGMVWIAGLPVGAASVTLTPQGGTAMTVTGIPVADTALTFVNVALP